MFSLSTFLHIHFRFENAPSTVEFGNFVHIVDLSIKMKKDSCDMDTTRVDENESNDSTSSSTLCSLNGKCPIVDEVLVFVMTPAILLNCLRHSFFKLNLIKFLIMDECCHVRGKHPYACIMTGQKYVDGGEDYALCPQASVQTGWDDI
ncbi:hypothetical protein VNO78_18703 [Psophocarpus tetragonolobus]|uniref:Uncharacterized protein n=1 Tax=Psophocarpus tetragonolobus TaxID=3891 RepID=A0AAN9S8R4_PSOTE